ncbi:hypothetical protein DXG01_016461 [Tephrocybe rancida]|nr:hypothetical protein DXG01_016461 [Tephrocybe rancida]
MTDMPGHGERLISFREHALKKTWQVAEEDLKCILDKSATIEDTRKKAIAAKQAFLATEEEAISRESAVSNVQGGASDPPLTSQAISGESAVSNVQGGASDPPLTSEPSTSMSQPADPPLASEPSASMSQPEAPKRPVPRKRLAPQANASQVKLDRPISIEGKPRSSSLLSKVPSDLEPLVTGKNPTDVGTTAGPGSLQHLPSTTEAPSTAAPIPTIVVEHEQVASRDQQVPTPTTTVPPGTVKPQQLSSTTEAPLTGTPGPTIIVEHEQLATDDQQVPAPMTTVPPGTVKLQLSSLAQQPASTLTAKVLEVQPVEIVMSGLIEMRDEGEGSESDSPLAKASAKSKKTKKVKEGEKKKRKRLKGLGQGSDSKSQMKESGRGGEGGGIVCESEGEAEAEADEGEGRGRKKKTADKRFDVLDDDTKLAFPGDARAAIRAFLSAHDFLVPEAATISREVAIHFLTTTRGNRLCLYHHAVHKDNSYRPGQNTPFVITGQPGPRVVGENDEPAALGYFECGCLEEAALLDFIMFKTVAIRYPKGSIWEGMKERLLEPRTHMFMQVALKGSGLEANDFYTGVGDSLGLSRCPFPSFWSEEHQHNLIKRSLRKNSYLLQCLMDRSVEQATCPWAGNEEEVDSDEDN